MNQELIDELASFHHDAFGFVLFAFPWGEPNTELAKLSGPEPWQEVVLIDIGEKLRRGQIDLAGAIQIARTSGHGIGKSALVSWVILWAIMTFEDTRGVVTANTENQLKTKTWVELAKWYRLCLFREAFDMTATAIFSADPEHSRTWRIDMVPWSERNTEAFAGLHNQGKRILVVFDEASAIPDVIWETTEGALTDSNTEILWMVFGNPTRNKGRFRECFPGGRFGHRWDNAAIDSRTVSFTDKTQIQRWIDDYGEDSDFVRVRVRGVFPRVDSESFIPYDLARQAVNREIIPQRGTVVLGVDVGRFGDDPSVIYPRCGRDAITRPIEIYPGIDTMTLVGKIAAAFLRHKASVVFVDEGGVGGGVVDRLRQLRIPVIGVDFGSGADGTNPDDGAKYANKRAEIWGAMRNWLPGGAIPSLQSGDHTTLVDELSGPTYGLNAKEEIQLESKKDMRKRNVPSPNVADALACTFAMPSIYFEPISADELHSANTTQGLQSEYDPYKAMEKELANTGSSLQETRLENGLGSRLSHDRRRPNVSGRVHERRQDSRSGARRYQVGAVGWRVTHGERWGGERKKGNLTSEAACVFSTNRWGSAARALLGPAAHLGEKHSTTVKSSLFYRAPTIGPQYANDNKKETPNGLSIPQAA